MLVDHGMLAKSGNVGSVDVSLINSFFFKAICIHEWWLNIQCLAVFTRIFFLFPFWVPCNS